MCASPEKNLGRPGHALETLLEDVTERCPDEDLALVLAARSRITWSPQHVELWLESCVREIVSGEERTLRLRYGDGWE